MARLWKTTLLNALSTALYELGINFFDSANVYEQGEGERVMAQALRLLSPSRMITTKAFWPMGEPQRSGLVSKHAFEQLHQSLRRMRLDYVDIFYAIAMILKLGGGDPPGDRRFDNPG